MKFFWLLLTAVILTGCTNIDYTGRKFSPQEHVKFVTGKDQVPDGYTLIGRFTADAGVRTHQYFTEEEVLERAREYGGDILCFTGSKVLPHGVYTPNAREFGAPDLSKRTVSKEEKAAFTAPAELKSNKSNIKRRHFYYLLYKKTEEVNRQLGY